MNETADPRSIVLPDGRRLAYAEYGMLDGRPLLYFHGLPGSRIEARLLHAAAAKQGIRLIAVDRPGIGGSDYLGDRRISDWPKDVSALTDAFGFERVAILAISGGAPYALACAAIIPERLTRVTVVGGIAPLDMAGFSAMQGFSRFGLRLACIGPAFAQLFVGLCAWTLRRDALGTLDWVARYVPPADRATLARPQIKRALAESFTEAVRGGSRGPSKELVLLARPWDFPLTDVRAPVSFWYGEADAVVPAALGRNLVKRVPDCRAHFLPGEGHYSLPVGHAESILAECSAPEH
jgi:pimeloyl-ACP methyl ester carboxylesterase